MLVTLGFVFVAGWIGSELADVKKKPWDVQERMAERVAEGKAPTARSYREIWVWYGAAGSAAIFLFLGISARWWFFPAKVDLNDGIKFGTGRAIPRFGIIVLLIVAAAAVPRVARMNLSIWGDEDWALYSYVWGEFSEQEDGQLQFERHPWTTTFFHNKRANNHVLQSALSKLCLEGWNKLQGIGEARFVEWTTRVPLLVAGLAGIAAMAYWLRSLGCPLAGMIAAILLAVHPNHVRYSSEARGYGIALTFLILSSWMLCLALRHDSKWRHWILFALFQAFALYSFTACIYVLILLNAGVAILLLHRHFREREAGALVALKRWFVVNVVSGCVYATLALPIVLQAMRYLSTSSTFMWEMSADHYRILWSRVIVGFDFAKSHPDNPLDLGVSVTPGGIVALIVLTVAFLLGVIWFAWRERGHSFLLLAPVSAAGLALGHAIVKGHAVFPQYLLPSFPAAVAVLAWSLARFGERLAKNTPDRFWIRRLLPTVMILGVCAVVFWKSLSIWVTQPIENLRAAAEVTRWQHDTGRYANESEAMVVSLWRSWESYDPRLKFDVQTPEQLEEVIVKAQSEGKPLYVVVGHRALAEQLNAGILEMLSDESRFEAMDTLWAPELFVCLWPYRLKE